MIPRHPDDRFFAPHPRTGPEPVTRVYTTLVAVDIAGFGAPGRDEEVREHLREAMYRLLTAAFALTGLAWDRLYVEDRGDGALIAVPPGVAAEKCLEPLGHHLHAAVSRHNRLTADRARLRLRVAVHAGAIGVDHHGVTGEAVLHLFRLLDAAAFKRALDHSGADLAMIVSDPLHNDTARRGGLVASAAYRPLRITCKETRAPAWLWLPPATPPPR